MPDNGHEMPPRVMQNGSCFSYGSGIAGGRRQISSGRLLQKPALWPKEVACKYFQCLSLS